MRTLHLVKCLGNAANWPGSLKCRDQGSPGLSSDVKGDCTSFVTPILLRATKRPVDDTSVPSRKPVVHSTHDRSRSPGEQLCRFALFTCRKGAIEEQSASGEKGEVACGSKVCLPRACPSCTHQPFKRACFSFAPAVPLLLPSFRRGTAAVIVTTPNYKHSLTSGRMTVLPTLVPTYASTTLPLDL